MSYGIFLLCFVIVPALALAAALQWTARSHQTRRAWLRRHWIGTVILTLIALVWTTPWDNFIIANGVWSYGEDRVIGTIGLVPVEEYGFIVLMPFFNAALMACLLLRRGVVGACWRSPQPLVRRRALFFYTGLWLVGLGCLGFEPAFYLSAILLWFVPPLALQAVFDPASLLRHWRVVATGSLLPTVYFSVVDAFAIRSGIWQIHDATRTGIELGNLPIEEALFFFTTSLLLAQGLVLWHTLFNPAEE